MAERHMAIHQLSPCEQAPRLSATGFAAWLNCCLKLIINKTGGIVADTVRAKQQNGHKEGSPEYKSYNIRFGMNLFSYGAAALGHTYKEHQKDARRDDDIVGSRKPINKKVLPTWKIL